MGKFFTKIAYEVVLPATDDNIFTSINVPTVFHKDRDKALVANTSIYALKNKKEVKAFINDVKKFGYNKKVFDKWDDRGDIHTIKQGLTAPILFNKKKYKKWKGRPMEHVFVGTKKDQTKMFEDGLKITLKQNASGFLNRRFKKVLDKHLGHQREIVDYTTDTTYYRGDKKGQ